MSHMLGGALVLEIALGLAVVIFAVGLAVVTLRPRGVLTAIGLVMVKLARALRVPPATGVRWLGALATTVLTLLAVSVSVEAVATVVPQQMALAVRRSAFFAIVLLAVAVPVSTSRVLRRRETLLGSEDAAATDLIRVVGTPLASLAAMFMVYTLGVGIHALEVSHVTRHIVGWTQVLAGAVLVAGALTARRVWRWRRFVEVDEVVAEVKAGTMDAELARRALAKADAARDFAATATTKSLALNALALNEGHRDVLRSTWAGIAVSVAAFVGIMLVNERVTPVPYAGFIGFTLLAGVPMVVFGIAQRRVLRDNREWAEATAQGFVPSEYER